MLLRRRTIPGAVGLERLPPIDFVGQLTPQLMAGDALIDNLRRLGNDALKTFGDDRHGITSSEQQEQLGLTQTFEVSTKSRGFRQPVTVKPLMS